MFVQTINGSFRNNLGCRMAVLLAAFATMDVAMAAEPPAAAGSNKVESAVVVATPIENLEQKWGIQLSGLFLSAGGNMVDFRYKVVDPAKAAFLTKPEIKPELLNQVTGTKLIVPNSTDVGPMRQTSRPYVAGKLYFMLFANTRHHVKSGDKVTISAGDFKVENLIVE